MNVLKSKFNQDPIFGFYVPEELENVGKEICNPKIAWENENEYLKKAEILKKMFIDNYEKYKDPNFTAV